MEGNVVLTMDQLGLDSGCSPSEQYSASTYAFAMQASVSNEAFEQPQGSSTATRSLYT